MIKGLNDLKKYFTPKDMNVKLRWLHDENVKLNKTIKDRDVLIEELIEDKKSDLAVVNKKLDQTTDNYNELKQKQNALVLENEGYKLEHKRLKKEIAGSKRELEKKDGEIGALKKDAVSHKSQMNEMERKMSTMKDELENDKRVIRKLRSKIRRMSKQIVKEDNPWQYRGVSEEGGGKLYHFESPLPDVKKDPTAFDPGTEPTKIYKIPGKLNLSAFDKTMVDEDEVYACIEDKKNNLSFHMPYQLYRFIRGFLGKVVKEKYSGMDLHTLAEPLCLSLLELRAKKEPEIGSKIKRIEDFGRLNAERELSIKEIADKCGISTVEARMPLSRLCHRGVCRRVRRGYYVFEKVADSLKNSR